MLSGAACTEPWTVRFLPLVDPFLKCSGEVAHTTIRARHARAVGVQFALMTMTALGAE